MNKTLKIGGAIIGGLIVFYFTLASFGPSLEVVTGAQLPKRYIKIIHKLNLIDENEKIRLFYSDVIFNIKNGMYFTTEDKLILYSKKWNQPKIIVQLNDIIEVQSNLQGDFWDDATFWIRTSSDEEYTFPISGEDNSADRFYNFLKRNCKNLKSVQDSISHIDTLLSDSLSK